MIQTGIYFLIKRKTVVYIGQTIAWPIRVAAHKNIDFDRCRFIPYPQDRLDDVERRLIKKFTPCKNHLFVKQHIKGVSDEWVLSHMAFIGSGDINRIVDAARIDFRYSPRTTKHDIYHSIINKYDRLLKTQPKQP